MKPNVLLVVLDSVRARNTSVHGYPRATTPFLSEFADRSETYLQARSPGIHSIASHVSIFTGYEVHQHGIRRHEANLAPDKTIWEELSTSFGYDTGMFTYNSVITTMSNLSSFFDTAITDDRMASVLFADGLRPADTETTGMLPYLRACLDADHTAESAFNGVIDKLDSIYVNDVKPRFDDPLDYDDRAKQSDEYYVEELLKWTRGRDRWAACLNLVDAHYPYEPDEQFSHWSGSEIERLHGNTKYAPMTETFHSESKPWWQLEAFEHLYDGCIRQVDALVERILTTLTERDTLEETLVVITSDHGECFGERSLVEPGARLVDHSYGINEELTHVPLIVNYPNQSGSDRVTEPVTLSSFPTAVRDVVEDSRSERTFLSDDPVISTTYRLEKPSESLPEQCPDPTRYGGVWHAVYRREDGDVVKYARRRNNKATIRIPNAQTAYRVTSDDDGVVDRTLQTTKRGVDVKQSPNELDARAESRLKELGYISE